MGIRATFGHTARKRTKEENAPPHVRYRRTLTAPQPERFCTYLRDCICSSHRLTATGWDAGG